MRRGGETIKKIRGHSNAISPQERGRGRGMAEGEGRRTLQDRRSPLLPNYDGINEQLESQLT